MITKKSPIWFYIIFLPFILSVALIFILPYTEHQLVGLFFSNFVAIPLFIFSILGFIYGISCVKSGIIKNKKDDRDVGILLLIVCPIVIFASGLMLSDYYLDGFGTRQIEVTKKIQLAWCGGSRHSSCHHCIDIEGDIYRASCSYYDDSDLKYLDYSEYDENRPMIEYKLKILEHSRLILDAKKVE